ILVSDQAETAAGGVVTPAMRDALARIGATQPETVIWADSRIRAEHFRGVVVKANRQEAEGASVRALGRVDFQSFRQHVQSPLLVVTDGANGALVVDQHRSETVLARRV